MKPCTKCRVAFPMAEFCSGRTRCRACTSEDRKLARARDPEKARAKERAAYHKRVARGTLKRVPQQPGYWTERWHRAKETNPVYQLVMRVKAQPCVDCGCSYPPEVMDLDHVRGEKSFEFAGQRIMSRSIDAVLAEIAKCDVRCPTCHRLRHFRERRAQRDAQAA